MMLNVVVPILGTLFLCSCVPVSRKKRGRGMPIAQFVLIGQMAADHQKQLLPGAVAATAAAGLEEKRKSGHWPVNVGAVIGRLQELQAEPALLGEVRRIGGRVMVNGDWELSDNEGGGVLAIVSQNGKVFIPRRSKLLDDGAKPPSASHKRDPFGAALAEIISRFATQ